MTTPQQNNTQFNARADQAALALKGGMRDRNGQPLQPRQVQVDANGQPARPLPPEGSYARQAIERQRAAAAARMNPQDDAGQLPPDAGAPPQPQGLPPQNQEPLVAPESPNVQRRFSELSSLLRQKDQELQQALARSRQLEESQAQTQARLAAIEQNYNQMVNQNLDALDPDTRMQVLQDARIQEALAGLESRIMGRISPVLDGVRQRTLQADLTRLAERYPGFSAEIHLPLIEMFREKNPNCSVEQAFRAVAEPEELGVGQARAPAIPPIAVPTPGNGAPRYVPTPDPNKLTPEQEIEQDRQRAFALARSEKPEDRRQAGRAMDELLRRKLDGRLPTGMPNYRR